MFRVPRDTPGFRIGKVFNKSGWRFYQNGEMIFENARVPHANVVGEVGGAVLAVSQFTLLGDVRRGKRPSFDAAARPQQARRLYECFVEKVRAAGLPGREIRRTIASARRSARPPPEDHETRNSRPQASELP